MRRAHNAKAEAPVADAAAMAVAVVADAAGAEDAAVVAGTVETAREFPFNLAWACKSRS